MPESIISFPVDDGPFKAFLDLYNKFQESIKRLPEDWEKVNSGIEKGSVSLDHLLAGILGQNQILTDTLKIHENIAKIEEARDQRSEAARQAKERLAAEKEIERQAESQARYWRDMSSSAGKFAVNIKDATLSLLKWSSITGLIGGLLGGGGLFGISRLAESASGGRQSSLALGIPYGQQQAFGINYGRYLGGQGGAESFLGGVQGAMLDVTQRQSFYGAGITEDMMKGKNTAEVGDMLLDRLRSIAVQNKGSPTFSNRWNALQLNRFMSPEQAQILGNTSDKEFAETRGGFRRDMGNMNIADAGLKRWQDLNTQLERAAQLIKSTFIDGLTPLIPEIKQLSEGVVELIDALLKGDNGKKNVELLQEGLHWLAAEVSDKGFQDSIISFVTGIERMAAVLVRFVGHFGEAPQQDQMLKDRSGSNKDDPDTKPDSPVGRFLKNFDRSLQVNPGQDFMDRLLDRLFKGRSSGPLPDSGTGDAAPAGVPNPLLIPAAFRYPGNVGGGNGGNYSGSGTAPLDLISLYESNNQNVPNYRYDSTHTAQGYYQITNTIWREIAPLVGAGQYPNAMSAPREVQRAVAEELYRRRGIQPSSTNRTLMNHLGNDSGSSRPLKSLTALRDNQRMRIEVNNNTGGSAVIGARQLAGWA